jgi:hypothetical protein
VYNKIFVMLFSVIGERFKSITLYYNYTFKV